MAQKADSSADAKVSNTSPTAQPPALAMTAWGAMASQHGLAMISYKGTDNGDNDLGKL